MSEYCTCATSDYCQVHDEIKALWTTNAQLKARLAEAEALLRGPIRYALTAPTDGWKGEVERVALDAIRAFLTPA